MFGSSFFTRNLSMSAWCSVVSMRFGHMITCRTCHMDQFQHVWWWHLFHLFTTCHQLSVDSKIIWIRGIRSGRERKKWSMATASTMNVCQWRIVGTEKNIFFGGVIKGIHQINGFCTRADNPSSYRVVSPKPKSNCSATKYCVQKLCA